MEPETVEEVQALLKERPDDAELHQLLGRRYFERNEFGDAHDAFRRSFELDPNDPFTCMLWGTLLTLGDDGSKQVALDLLERARYLAPDLPVAHLCVGNYHLSLVNYRLAEQAYLKALELDPNYEDGQRRLAALRESESKGRKE